MKDKTSKRFKKTLNDMYWVMYRDPNLCVPYYLKKFKPFFIGNVSSRPERYC